MPQLEKPWTTAMLDHLRAHEGQWLSKEEVLAVGAAIVPEDVARHEMRNRSGKLTDERLISAGRKSKALQGLSGQHRFGKVEYSEDKKLVKYLGDDAFSLGDVGQRVEVLERLVEELTQLVDSQQRQLDRLDSDEQPGPDGSGPDAEMPEDFLAQLDLHTTGG